MGSHARQPERDVPFNRDSSAFALDYLGSQLRGCYEGWQHWLGGAYGAGDIWGCVGLWYAGDWHSAAGDGYTSRVQNEISNLTWLKARLGLDRSRMQRDLRLPVTISADRIAVSGVVHAPVGTPLCVPAHAAAATQDSRDIARHEVGAKRAMHLH